eukprot:CAMPEP_0183710752 /NCGR_PEP_ID=MMETSP0737-20130205/6412_1 /TAXON_ID=385413 /ORGANISM="Thalassiosira miniscula, Strain CCMP1093" /LENGTH=299 /DNA_ID=CAMNT_0025939087 /DNA_START=116 /DNA_END=1011 /DNA_ORIENTATION=+
MKVTILYGSATGNAEHIAKDLGKTINESAKGISNAASSSSFSSADVMEMNMFKRKKLMESWVQPPTTEEGDIKKHALILVCSTTGNGDAPENAGRFVRFIKKPPPSTLTSTAANPSSPLENVAYAVLGLGDTNYDQFCGSAKLVDKKMSDWGAQRAVPLACADEATGLEATVEPWLDGVLEGLEKACKEGGKEEENVKLSEELDQKLNVSDDGGKAVQKTDIPQSTALVKNGTASKASTASDLTSTTKTTASAPSNDATKTATTSTPTAAAPSKSPTPLYILYGSATGNAEHIAKDLTA